MSSAASATAIVPPSIPPPINITPALDITKREDPHKRRRRFIGPLPLSVYNDAEVRVRASNSGQSKGKQKWLSSLWSKSHRTEEEEDESVRSAIREHAYRFFIGHGGKDEDWNESAEHRVREEMMRKWNESEWAKLRSKRKKQPQAVKNWVGNSFDIGVFLGVDILPNGHTHPVENIGDTTTAGPKNGNATHASTVTGKDTFVTAPSQFNDGEPSVKVPQVIISAALSTSSAGHPQSIDGQPRISADSHTPLLDHTPIKEHVNPIGEVRSEVIKPSRSNLSVPTTAALGDTNLTSTKKPKGKRKMVHYDSTSMAGVAEEEEEEEQPPVPPSEVLARTGSAADGTSAGAAQQASIENQHTWGDVIMRDRMLVRVSYTEDVVPAHFDEGKNRITRHIEDDDWAEYIVAWRKDRLEIYRDHSTYFREWYSGHKHLAFIVPLASRDARLSLYSFVDLSFCIACPPTPLKSSKGRWLLHGTPRGTNIFVFQVKSRTRAADWMWNLWRYMGGTLPSAIEVRSPALDTRVVIDIPNHANPDMSKAYSVFTRSNVISLCRKALKHAQGYDMLIQKPIDNGSALELAWRFDANLDWVWQLNDVEGKFRDWAVLYGLALRQGGRPAHLELRLKQHLPTRLHLKDGTRLDEPIDVEGYVERVKPNTQLRESLYLATHSGYLFAIPPSHGHPPSPPGPCLSSPTDDDKAEVKRGTQQIMDATGVSDLRSIVAVRRAFSLLPGAMERPVVRESHNWEDAEEFWRDVERREEDDQDKGGEDGLALALDKPHLRMRRSFEFLLTTGRVIRFETHSCQVALEWITRLRPLVHYWRKRHQVDAKEEMDLAHFGAGRLRVTPQRHQHDEDSAPPEPIPDPEASLPDLSSFYNWCTLDDCRPILKCGRTFARKGLKGPYKQIQLALISGFLYQYHITGRSSLHHRRYGSISLIDAYVTSGHFAASHLPQGQYNPDNPPLARRYQDGLESDESEEDTLLMIWYRPKVVVNHTAASAPDSPTANGEKTGLRPTDADIPSLTAKRKIAVFRTRSKLERDAWVWAINSEIDKLVRSAMDREAKMREDGELMKT